MSKKEGYDVLRLIEHGQICYISSEYIQGMTLVRQLKQAKLSKQQLLLWIQEIVKQLELIHRCRGNPCYQYVNPYSVIVSEDQKIYFLDLQAGSNQEMLRMMRRREIREHFLPPQENYYQKSSLEMDIYGLGRTIQYLLAQTKPDPPLGRWEEIKIQKIISKCLKWQSKRSYHNLSEIRKQIPEYKRKEKRKTRKLKRKILVGIGILSFAATGKYVVTASDRWNFQVEDEKEAGNESAEVEVKTEYQNGQQHAMDYIDLALAYFLDVDDYEKSMECLQKVYGNEICADDLEKIIAVAAGKEEIDDLDNYMECLEHLEQNMPVSKSDSYERCLIRGYQILETKEAAEQIVRIGKRFLEREEVNEEGVYEVKEAMITACENLEENEEAAEICVELLGMETQYGKKEELYKRAVMLYVKCDKSDRALEVCGQGVREMENSDELKLLHIRLLCGETSIHRDLCAQTIQGYIRKNPGLLETEEFLKLQKEYEIRVEGEEVWVGRSGES
ncbi:MAG: hypothetical protein MR224_12270 [Dorea sp.]|nr:hypothetical protein [Dorea sp.]